MPWRKSPTRSVFSKPYAAAPTEGSRLQTAQRRQPREVAHLAPWPHQAFAIEVQARLLRRERQPLPGFLADNVLHHRIRMALGIPQRPARHRSDMLLELAHHTGFDGPVPRIVHPRRDLVDSNLAGFSDEELDPQHADIIQRFG